MLASATSVVNAPEHIVYHFDHLVTGKLADVVPVVPACTEFLYRDLRTVHQTHEELPYRLAFVSVRTCVSCNGQAYPAPALTT